MRRERTENVQKRVIYEVECDSCGKVVHRGEDGEGWHDFNSYHSDWGNDSVESGERHDACSWPCYLVIVRTIFEDYGGQEQDRRLTLIVDGFDWWFVRGMLEAHK